MLFLNHILTLKILLCKPKFECVQVVPGDLPCTIVTFSAVLNFKEAALIRPKITKENTQLNVICSIVEALN